MGRAKATMLGRLTRDPELRYTPNGIAVCQFSIACDRGWGDKKKTDFFDVTAWRERGEAIAKFFKKGSEILVHSTPIVEEWEDRESGKRRTKITFTMDDFEFTGGSRVEGAGSDPFEQGHPDDAPQSHPRSEKTNDRPKTPRGQDLPDDDDVPF